MQVGRTQLLAVSLGVHVALGLGLAAIPHREAHEAIAISMTDTKKAKAPAHVDPPPEPPEPSKAAPRAAHARSAAPKVAAAANAQASSPADALPDFGLSLSGGGPGLAVPSGGGGGPAATTASKAKVLSRAGATRPDDCADPPAKPKLLSRPSPTYTDAARAAGISGKVRVEITVDEGGRVVSVRLLQGLGYGLDEAALAAARAMTFEAAVRCGRPASATFKIGFNFSP
jgi:periplasmic protein TonB